MNRRRVILNSALGLAVAGVGVLTTTTIVAARTTTPVGQAVAVTRGTVVNAVSATGNVEAVERTALNLAGSGGTVTKVYVRQGQRVTKGQRLVKVDDASQRRSLDTARAGLASAQAKLTTTTQPRSGAEVGQDDANIANAAQSVSNAERTLRAARATYALDVKQQDKVVHEAEDAVNNSKGDLSDAKSALSDAKKQLETDQQAAAQPTGGQQTGGQQPTDQQTADADVSADQSEIANLNSAVISARSQLDSDRSNLRSVKLTRATTLLKDKQSIGADKDQVASAQRQLDQQRAAAGVNAQPAREGALKDAQAQVDSAEVDVATARRGVADTVLKAPEDGTVATISAVVGQSSSSGSAGNASGSGSASSAGGSAGGSSSGTSTADSTSSSGLVVLTDLTRKEINAKVAEVDATKLKPGLKAQATFPASGLSAPGTITSIDTEQTVTNNVVEYGIKVRLDAGDRSVKVGQTATLSITAAQHNGVLIVPTSALRTVDGRSTVTRRVNGADTDVTVQTGLVGTEGTEVTAGLSEGDLVVLPVTGGS